MNPVVPAYVYPRYFSALLFAMIRLLLDQMYLRQFCALPLHNSQLTV